MNVFESRARLYHEARQANDPGTAGRIWSEVDRLDAQTQRQQRAIVWPDDADDDPRTSRRGTAEYRASFDKYLRRGESALTAAELRALQADVDPTGGYTVLPEQLAESVIKAVDNSLVMRQLATRVEVASAQSIGVPVIDADPADADWTTELGTGGEDSSMAFGKRELVPYPAAKKIKASSKLVRNARNAGRLIGERLANSIGRVFEKAYLTGDGAKKPLGVFTASSMGISTARDVSTGNTTTSIKAPGLLNALYSLRERYLGSPALRWLFHRDGIKQIRSLRYDAATEDDGLGGFLFRPAERAGESDTLLGVPVILSEYAPNTFTAGLYVGLVGDFSHYWIADAGPILIQRLSELYAVTSQVGYIGRFEGDGMPALEEAFARVTLAAS
jgi:HK97 family phage major capsid protein